MGISSHNSGTLTFVPTALGALLIVVIAPAVHGANVAVALNSSVTYNDMTYQADDLLQVDTGANIATLLLTGDYFDNAANIDALFLPTDGSVWFSTAQDETVAGVATLDGDVVRYDPGTHSASVILSEALFSDDEDVDAVFVRDNGNILLSTETPATLGGLSFDDSDVVEYDPISDVATLFLQGSTVFTLDSDIDAFHLLPDGRVVLSTRVGASIGELSFDDDDLMLYDPSTQSASLIFDGVLFGSTSDINAVHVNAIPVPTAFWLLLSGLATLARFRRRPV